MTIEGAALSALYNGLPADGNKSAPEGVLRRITSVARPYRWQLAAFLGVTIVLSGLGVLTPVLAGRVVDAITLRQPLRQVLVLAAVIAAIAIAEAAFGLLARWQASSLGEDVTLQLRLSLYQHVQRMPIAFFTRTHTGALMSRLHNDVFGAQRAFTDILSGVTRNLVTLLLTLIVMLSISWQITLCALLLLPAYVLPARRVGVRMARYEREGADTFAAMNSQAAERFSAPGATLVKLFADPLREVAEFERRARRVRDIGVRAAMLQWTFVTGLVLASALALALVYAAGGFYALRSELQPGAVVTFALLLTRLYAPLTSLASARVDVMGALVSFERVFEVLDLEPLLQEKPAAVDLPAGPVSVEFRDVCFSYPRADQVSLASLEEVEELDTRSSARVLHHVSFRAGAGSVLAIVGSTGAGKSTIAHLAARLYDVDSGSVRLAGVDVRDLTTQSIRRTVGVVTQDGHLFHDSVRENLLLVRPEATDDELWQALRQARLEEVVRALPDGLDTVVGERGYRFSGGERQRLTIARVLLAQSRVVILDEATAHLDSVSEAAVQAALDEVLDGRTAIVIAHRLSTVRAADTILVLEHGRIVESGSHRELVTAGGRYEHLHSTQLNVS